MQFFTGMECISSLLIVFALCSARLALLDALAHRIAATASNALISSVRRLISFGLICVRACRNLVVFDSSHPALHLLRFLFYSCDAICRLFRLFLVLRQLAKL